MLKKFFLPLVVSLTVSLFFCCSSLADIALEKQNNQVQITILQMNDVYEIDPVNGGKEGGLARVASLRDILLQKNPNTITVLAGDLFSPSALGTAPYEGGRLDGKQIVAAMNALGLDYMIFGNHEFDIKKESFYTRLEESKFEWISSNCFAEDGKPFPKVAEHKIIQVKGVKIGIFSATLTKNKVDYVTYKDPFTTAQEQVAELRPKVDILIALTHLNVDDDVRLANKFPEIDLILGGHEHENMQLLRGRNYTPIFKADANARTVYIHDLLYDKNAEKKLTITSKLQRITDALPDQEKTAKVVQKWRKIGYAGFNGDGFDPKRAVATTDVALDGLEASVRNFPTKLTELIARSMLTVAEGAQVSIYNSGSVRIDDVIPAGQITEYDVIRILPFGGDIVTVQMKGSLLKQVIEQGKANKGSGAYLQLGNVSGGNGEPWLIDGKELAEDSEYLVAITEFLVKIGDDNLEFLVNNPDLPILENKGDVRKALIAELKSEFPAK